MKYIIDNFKVNPKTKNTLDEIIKEKLKINDFKYKILHKSIDARNKEDIYLVYKLLLDTNNKINGKNISKYIDNEYKIEYKEFKGIYRPVIVGFGPAGMFCALYLARINAKPIIIERGSQIEKRKEDVNNFINSKLLNPNSNIQFGEGGAGTFSDGKLNTNVKDPLIKFILNEFYIHGAKEDILYDSRPHIGTDYLEKIVKNIREEIIILGGEFYFNHLFTDVKINENFATAYAKNLLNDEIVEFKTNHLILGLGHSAKDTIRHLYNNCNMEMSQKAFSMGVRVEHPKEFIDYSQYKDYKDYLPSAYYKLAAHTKYGRGVYTFCMCPGGFVMPSQSENNTIVTNGMSNNKRDNFNSNSALLVDVRPSDYDKGNVLDGIDYQEKYEKLAYSISGDYRAPANLIKEFLNDTVASDLRTIKTTYPHGLKFSDLRECLPDFVIDNLKEGIIELDKKLKGFNNPDAILIGIESRSSSPVRFFRDSNRMSNIKFIYPIGEGAGYAGGITSSALDGLKTAMLIGGVNSEKN